jgi:hypothetical protein
MTYDTKQMALPYAAAIAAVWSQVVSLKLGRAFIRSSQLTRLGLPPVSGAYSGRPT